MAKKNKPIDINDLKDALRDNLSPDAIATIIAYLQSAETKHADINTEVRWFSDLLTELIGGNKMFGILCEEIGL